jgi:hypothetical protein
MELTWAGWLFLVATIIEFASMICLIGQPREPLSGGAVLINLTIWSFITWGLFTVGFAR